MTVLPELGLEMSAVPGMMLLRLHNLWSYDFLFFFCRWIEHMMLEITEKPRNTQKMLNYLI